MLHPYDFLCIAACGKEKADENKDAHLRKTIPHGDIDELLAEINSEQEVIIAQEGIDKLPHALEAGRPKDNPCGIDERKCEQPCGNCRHFLSEHLRPDAMPRQRKTMQGAPQHKCPRRAVPEAAQQEGDEQVAQGPSRAPAVATQRNVQIIAEPAGQRDVPAPPEVLYIRGLVGGIKVPRQMDIEEQRTAYGHVAVAGKVKVELERIGDALQGSFQKGQGACLIEAIVHDGGEIVGNEDFFGKTYAQDEQAVVDIFPVNTVVTTVEELRHHFLMMDNGAGNELRKEADKAAVVQEALMGGVMFLGIYIGKIGNLLKGEEADADGKHDAAQGKIGVQQGIETGNGEICILVIAERA